MRIPNKLPIDRDISGSQLKKSFNELVAFCKSLTPRSDLQTMEINTTPTGTTYKAKPQTSSGGSMSGGGTTVKFAKITGNTDANNYTASIYTKPDLSDTPVTGQTVYVMTITTTLANDSIIPVQSSSLTDIDYECTQQLAFLEKA